MTIVNLSNQSNLSTYQPIILEHYSTINHQFIPVKRFLDETLMHL